MSNPTSMGEIRPSTIESPADQMSLFPVPLLRLRGNDHPVIEPEDCRVTRCPVCA